MTISIIVAATENNVIGDDNDLVCKLPDDMKFFKRITTGHHILMGRKNYESINRPLPNRENLILSRDPHYRVDGAYTFTDVESAVKFANNNDQEELMVIGGGNIYRQLLPETDKIYLTRIHTEIDGDTYFPILDDEEWEITHEKFHEADDKHEYSFTYLTYERIK